MTREARIGAAVVVGVVGLLGWSVADGIAHRTVVVPAVAERARPPVPAAAVVEVAKAAEPEGAACCKDAASHSADHAKCPMKKAPTPLPAPSTMDASKCPYMSSQAARPAPHR